MIDKRRRRPPLSPILDRIELRETDLTAELMDALAECGISVSRETVDGWDPDQFFEALHWARAKAAWLRPKFEPEKPSFIP